LECYCRDGVGPVTALIDPTGGTNFTINVPLTGQTPQTVGTFTFTATVPSITCTGRNAMCTLQVASSSDWFSCSSILITSTGGAVPPPATCVEANQLSFCSVVDNTQVLLPGGQSNLYNYDLTLGSTFNATLNNPLVFSSPNAKGCYAAYYKLFCGFNLQLCSLVPAGCNQACLLTNSLCGIQNSHTGLYNCSNYLNTQADATGNCNSLSSGIKLDHSNLLLLFLLIFSISIWNL